MPSDDPTRTSQSGPPGEAAPQLSQISRRLATVEPIVAKVEADLEALRPEESTADAELRPLYALLSISCTLLARRVNDLLAHGAAARPEGPEAST